MAKLSASRVSVRDDIEAAFDLAYEKGWTDGLPIIPPTEERVRRMVGDRDPQEVIAEVAPALGEATIERIAINAVMAGCLPAYLPVLIAAVQAMAQPEFNLNGMQCTTNPVAPLAIINGPIVKELDVNCGFGCLGPGWRANATIGRAIRLILLNIGGAVPGTVTKATCGQPGRYTFCLAENEALNPWGPLHVERGFDRNTSTVTMVGATGTTNILIDHSLRPLDPLEMVAHSMTAVGSNNFVVTGGGIGEVLVILSPKTSGYIAGGGYSRKDVQKYLFENSMVPIVSFSQHQAHKITEEGRVHDGMVKLVPTPDDIMVIVAGGDSGSHSIFVPTFGTTRAVTRPIVR